MNIEKFCKFQRTRVYYLISQTIFFYFLLSLVDLASSDILVRRLDEPDHLRASDSELWRVESRGREAGDEYFRLFRVRGVWPRQHDRAACHKRCLIICRVDVESGVTATEGTWTAPLSIHSVRNALIPAIAASCPANVYDMTVKPRLFCR